MFDTTSKNLILEDENHIGPLFKKAEPVDGQLNVDLELRLSIAKAVTSSGKKRSIICAEISDLIGTEVRVHTFDTWTAESKSKSSQNPDQNNNKRWGVPAEIIPAICYVTSDYTPLKILVQIIGLNLMTAEQQADLYLASLREKKRNIEKEIRLREKNKKAVKR